MVDFLMFCSGPTKKYKEWHQKSKDKLLQDLGRSHRSELWIKRISEIYNLIRVALRIPEDYKIGFINGSATSAVDALLLNLLGNRPCNVLKTGVFSNRWSQEIFNKMKMPGKTIEFQKDAINQINQINQINAESDKLNQCHDNKYLNNYINPNPNCDFVFTMIETTNGFKWFDEEVLKKINGLKICDVTSAVFCEEIDWNLIDCGAFSFQKALGGEGGIGCIVVNSKALENLNKKFTVPRFMEINDNIFDAKLNNTPSLIALNDIEINLNIFMEKGGLSNAIKQCKENQINIMKSLGDLFYKTSDANGMLCVDFKKQLGEKSQLIKILSKKCEDYGIFDICGHPEDDPCFRFWAGPTLEWSEIQPYINKFINIVENDI
ncbi:hypothetical protein FZC35_00945 [Candidatus Cytomitobacter indipagum]|uniref:Phosphoserine transaminase n=2 Tax=Candidatus Cytomitobacter indipagum TaxID=2601575 RepID=A0A5C0UD92_9PROT|nr:hypothetical protein FZC35_00945 [Candidatus Cytomitobacter indipagum]